MREKGTSGLERSTWEFPFDLHAGNGMAMLERERERGLERGLKPYFSLKLLQKPKVHNFTIFQG